MPSLVIMEGHGTSEPCMFGNGTDDSTDVSMQEVKDGGIDEVRAEMFE
jgi:hypothetical protein